MKIIRRGGETDIDEEAKALSGVTICAGGHFIYLADGPAYNFRAVVARGSVTGWRENLRTADGERRPAMGKRPAAWLACEKGAFSIIIICVTMTNSYSPQINKGVTAFYIRRHRGKRMKNMAAANR